MSNENEIKIALEVIANGESKKLVNHADVTTQIKAYKQLEAAMAGAYEQYNKFINIRKRSIEIATKEQLINDTNVSINSERKLLLKRLIGRLKIIKDLKDYTGDELDQKYLVDMKGVKDAHKKRIKTRSKGNRTITK